MKLSHLVIAAFAISGASTLAAAHGGKMSQSSQSNDVSQAQQALNDKGFNAGPVDGIAGPKTKSALKQFQQSQGLQASGNLDGQTLAALEPGASSQSSSNSQASSSPFNPNDTQPSSGSQSSQASDTSMSSSPTISQSTSSMGSSQPPSSATPSDQSTGSQQSSNSSTQSSTSKY